MLQVLFWDITAADQFNPRNFHCFEKKEKNLYFFFFFLPPTHGITYGFLGNCTSANLEYPGEYNFNIVNLITYITERNFFHHKKIQLN